MTNRTAAIAIATTLLLMRGAAAEANAIGLETGPNLVVNGGFENTSFMAGSGWTASGFTLEGFDFSIDTNAADAKSGTHSFAGGGIGSPGFISQTLTTVPGTSYNIHLWLANFSGFADGTAIDVRWGGSTVYSASNILGFSYKEIVIDPLAIGTATTLSIGLRNDAFFLNVDDISVRAIAAVPEPATLTLMGLGLSGWVVWRRRAHR